MAMYSLNLMRISLELALHNPSYEDIASKFFEHFLHIAEAMTNMAGAEIGLWDDEDGFYYDELNLPDGRCSSSRSASMVGLIPLFAVEVVEPDLLDRLPGFATRLQWFLEHRPDLASLVSRWHEPGSGERHLLSLLRGHRMKRLLRRMLDETEFLAPFGIRSLSKVYAEQPYVFADSGRRSRCATSRANPTPPCSAATRIGADRSGFRSTTSCWNRSAASTAITATISGSNTRRGRARSSACKRSRTSSRRG
jgi:hypothetical protein